MIKPCFLRWCNRNDLEEVAEIEAESFSDHWDERDFLKYLESHRCVFIVAEFDGRILGFMIYRLHKDHIELVNLAVRKAYLRLTIGSQLVAAMKCKLTKTRRRIACVVVESNLEAQLFMRFCEFRCISTLRAASHDGKEDEYQFVFNHSLAAKALDAACSGKGRAEP